MENSGKEDGMTTELRRHLRIRVLAPFACSFVCIGLQRWLAAEHAGLGVVLDVSAGKTTIAKRDREKSKQIQRREKDARREQRKTEKPARPLNTEGEDPDLAGLQWGPQEPLY